MYVPYEIIFRLARIHFKIKYSAKEQHVKFIGNMTLSFLLSVVTKCNHHLLSSVKP